MKCEYELINDRQWIEVDLPNTKHFSVPIRIAKMAVAARLTDGEKDPLECLSDEDKKIDPTGADDDDDDDDDPDRFNEEESNFKSHAEDFNSSKPMKRKKLSQRIDLMEIFAKNPEPFKSHLLETNSSTLAFSSTHLLVHDQKKFILFDLKKKLYEFNWNDNEFGNSSPSPRLLFCSVLFKRHSRRYLLDVIDLLVRSLDHTFGLSLRSGEILRQ